jgi:hypothetical protein
MTLDILPKLKFKNKTTEVLMHYCSITFIYGNRVTLAFEKSQSALLNEEQGKRIAEAFSDHFGRPMSIYITIKNEKKSQSIQSFTIENLDDRKIKFGRFYIHEVGIRDWFTSCTLTIEEWLKRDDIREAIEDINKWDDLIAAIHAVHFSGYFDGKLREPPRIGYDVMRDNYYFIFKIDNNGTTFVVSDHYMPELEDSY